jgi:hypothetical protein
MVANGIAKTNSSDTFVTYYPFFKHHFDLHQNFLFVTKGMPRQKWHQGDDQYKYVSAKAVTILQTIRDGHTWQIARELRQSPPFRMV